MSKPKVYFSKKLTPENVVEVYKQLGITLPGRVAVKIHSGERGNQNYLRPDFMKPMIDYVDGTVVECNTAYEGARNTTERHIKLLAEHGFSEAFKVDLLDAEGPDLELEIPEGLVIKKNYVGKNLKNYDSLLVLSHFKGHPMGGYGGALKQLSIGCGSSVGKTYIHSGGKTTDVNAVWRNTAPQDKFLEAMADAAKSVADMFAGRVAYVSAICNLSVDCDCCEVAEDPCMADIGIAASLDPVALDRACLDLIYASDDPGLEHFVERVTSRHGEHTIEAAEKLGMGSTDYELIRMD